MSPPQPVAVPLSAFLRLGQLAVQLLERLTVAETRFGRHDSSKAQFYKTGANVQSLRINKQNYFLVMYAYKKMMIKIC